MSQSKYIPRLKNTYLDKIFPELKQKMQSEKFHAGSSY